MGDTSIEWADKSWNPVTGCTKVSPGCKHCYAERVFPRTVSGQCDCGHRREAHVLVGRPNKCGSCDCGDYRQRLFTDVRCHPDRLEQPLRWRKPARIFVNSMSDLFHEDVPFEFIEKVLDVAVEADQHIYQILTKRPQRMQEVIFKWLDDASDPSVGINAVMPKNIWLGVSVENQQYADERIPLLLQTPAAVRFISYEPALGPIDFDSTHESDPCESNFLSGIAGERVYDGQKCTLDWIIVGGESGPGARPFNVQWARLVVQQCKAAGVACFYKQGGHSNRCQHDSKGGHFECFPPDLRVREFPNAIQRS